MNHQIVRYTEKCKFKLIRKKLCGIQYMKPHAVVKTISKKCLARQNYCEKLYSDLIMSVHKTEINSRNQSVFIQIS